MTALEPLTKMLSDVSTEIAAESTVIAGKVGAMVVFLITTLVGLIAKED